MAEVASAGSNGVAGSSRGEEPLGELVSRASREISELVRAEVELAKVELAGSAKAAGLGAALLGAAAAFGAVAGLFVLVAAALLLHGTGLALGWCFLVVAAGLLLLAGPPALLGVTRLRRARPPQRTIASARDTVAVLRHRENA